MNKLMVSIAAGLLGMATSAMAADMPVKAVKKALSEFIGEVRKHEPRTLYLIFREDGQHTFVHWMWFENEAAERRHSQSRYNDRFAKKLLEAGSGNSFGSLADSGGIGEEASLLGVILVQIKKQLAQRFLPVRGIAHR